MFDCKNVIDKKGMFSLLGPNMHPSVSGPLYVLCSLLVTVFLLLPSTLPSDDQVWLPPRRLPDSLSLSGQSEGPSCFCGSLDSPALAWLVPSQAWLHYCHMPIWLDRSCLDAGFQSVIPGPASWSRWRTTPDSLTQKLWGRTQQSLSSRNFQMILLPASGWEPPGLEVRDEWDSKVTSSHGRKGCIRIP